MTHVHDPFRCPAHVPGCDCPDLDGWLCNPYHAAGHCPDGLLVMPDDAVREARLAEIEEHHARKARLEQAHGIPETIAPCDALALARTAHVPVDASVTADDVYASIYRDEAAAEAWMESNRVHYGHPGLARVPLPDGRVVGILDLRPAMERAREES